MSATWILLSSTCAFLLFGCFGCAEPKSENDDAAETGDPQEQNEARVVSRVPYAVDPTSGDLVVGPSVADRGVFDLFTNHHEQLCAPTLARGLRPSGFLALEREGRLGLGMLGARTNGTR